MRKHWRKKTKSRQILERSDALKKRTTRREFITVFRL
jgi:hypothetical protein